MVLRDDIKVLYLVRSMKKSFLVSQCYAQFLFIFVVLLQCFLSDVNPFKTVITTLVKYRSIATLP